MARPKYCLLAVDVFSSKIYTYPMRQRDLLTKIFYEGIQAKRKGNKMRLQADMEFQTKNDIKDLNKKFNVEMFSTKIRVEKHLLQNKKFAS